MLPDRVSNPGPLTYESGALPIALRGPAQGLHVLSFLHQGDSEVGEMPNSNKGHKLDYC